jgi:hypothetical protein
MFTSANCGVRGRILSLICYMFQGHLFITPDACYINISHLNSYLLDMTGGFFPKSMLPLEGAEARAGGLERRILSQGKCTALR